MNPAMMTAILKAQNSGGGGSNKGLPPWAKGLIAVSVTGVVIFVAYKLYKLLDKEKRQDRADAKDTVAETESEINRLLKAGQKPSKPISTYKSTASSIAEKLQGCESRVAPETDVIKMICSVVKKRLDWLVLVREFGVKQIDDCGYPSGSTEYELGKLLKDQLDWTFNGKLEADGFNYDAKVSGNKTTFDILNIYLKKIGVTI